MPEELAFQQRVGQRGTVDRHERSVGSAALAMNGLGHQFLARATFTSDQDRGFGVSDAGKLVEEFLHRRAGPEHLVKPFQALHLLAQYSHLFLQLMVSYSSLQSQREQIEFDWLGNEVVRPHSDRCHRRLQAAEGRHHDHRYVWAIGRDTFAQFRTAHPRHFEISQHDLIRLGLDQLQRFLWIGLPRAIEVPQLQVGFEHFAHTHDRHQRSGLVLA